MLLLKNRALGNNWDADKFFCDLILYNMVVLQLYILCACPFRRLQPLSLVAEPFEIISAMAIWSKSSLQKEYQLHTVSVQIRNCNK